MNLVTHRVWITTLTTRHPASWKRAEGIGIMSGRGSDRKKNFKKGVDTDESRRKREETRIVVQSARPSSPAAPSGKLRCPPFQRALVVICGRP